MSTVNAPVPTDPRLDTRVGSETGSSTPASPKRSGLGGRVWWRHALGLVALAWALFPILFIWSAATNPSGTLNTASLWPSDRCCSRRSPSTSTTSVSSTC